jgi:hypothetical protein
MWEAFPVGCWRMQALRKRVRAIALAWLLCQAGSLTAFVPENCCIAHAEEAAAKATKEACHDAEPVKPEPGAACPMHSSKSKDCCAMTNACDGPGSHLVTLFAYIGAIERPATATVVLDSSPAVNPSPSSPRFRELTPDAPPPKA